MAVVAGGSSAVQAHVVKEEEETGFDHQLMGGITLFPVSYGTHADTRDKASRNHHISLQRLQGTYP